MKEAYHFIILDKFDSDFGLKIVEIFNRCQNWKDYKKYVKNLTRYCTGTKILIFDKGYKQFCVVYGGKIVKNFAKYMIYYPKNVTLYISDTGEDILCVKSSNISISDFMSNDNSNVYNLDKLSLCFAGGDTKRKFNKMLFPHIQSIISIEDVINNIHKIV